MTDSPADGAAGVADAERRRAQEARLMQVWQSGKGLRRLAEVNNSAVGLWYTATSFAFLLFGGVLALLIRAQLAVPDNDLVSSDAYSQLFTLHGSVMMFLFAVPILEAVAILLLPEMLGARDLPFPRLSAFGYWSFLIGGVFVCGSIFFDAAPRGGWFMYPPLTTSHDEAGIGTDIWLLGLSFIEIASIAAAVELIVGILKCRPPGMRINLMPLYAWYMLVVGGMILFAFPPLIAGDLLLELERAFDWPFFDASRGGDPLLWQHLFWIFGHPEVYIIFLPAVALVAMIVPTFAGRPMFGYTYIVLAAIGTGFLSFGLWVHHMYTTGLPNISLGFFSAASTAVAIPTGVQIFAFLATLLLGRVTRSVPILFCGGALAIFVLGGLTGVMVAIAPFDWQAHDSYFVVAHLHYVLIGGALFPIVAGLYYYAPIVTSKMLSPRLGTVAFWLMFAGFNIAFLPMHLSGLRGMPRRVFTYPEELGIGGLNLASTVGAFILAAGIGVVAWDVLRPKRHQPDADSNPWNGGTLEWLGAIPRQPWALRSVPEIGSRYPGWDRPELAREIAEARWYLPDAEELRRETLVTTVLDARPVQCLRLGGSTFVPLTAAAFTGAAFIFATYSAWWWTLAAAAAAVATILYWLWTGTALIPEKPAKDVGRGLVLPLYASGSDSVGWWAMFITMTGDGTAFLSLVFGYFYYWTIHAGFPPEGMSGPGQTSLYGAAAVFAAAADALAVTARKRNRAGRVAGARTAWLAATAAAIGSAAFFIAAPIAGGLDPTANVFPAIVSVLAWWAAVHTGLGALMLAYCLARSYAGRLTPRHDIDAWNVALYWHFTCGMAVVTVAILALFPRLA